jgi:hypothetical protein
MKRMKGFWPRHEASARALGGEFLVKLRRKKEKRV